jgi:hypothetical protein
MLLDSKSMLVKNYFSIFFVELYENYFNHPKIIEVLQLIYELQL